MSRFAVLVFCHLFYQVYEMGVLSGIIQGEFRDFNLFRGSGLSPDGLGDIGFLLFSAKNCGFYSCVLNLRVLIVLIPEITLVFVL